LKSKKENQQLKEKSLENIATLFELVKKMEE
jgi:hypothetical protein